MIAREKRRVTLSKNNWKQRKGIKKIITSPHSSEEERWQAVMQLQKRRRDESACRVRKLCRCCGRPRGVYVKRFYLCGICLRQLMTFGNLPGIVKSSW